MSSTYITPCNSALTQGKQQGLSFDVRVFIAILNFTSCDCTRAPPKFSRMKQIPHNMHRYSSFSNLLSDSSFLLFGSRPLWTDLSAESVVLVVARQSTLLADPDLFPEKCSFSFFLCHVINLPRDMRTTNKWRLGMGGHTPPIRQYYVPHLDICIVGVIYSLIILGD